MDTLRTLKKLSFLNRKKTDPEKFIFTGNYYIDETSIQLFKYNQDECKETNNISVSEIEKFEDNNYNYWLNIHGLHESEKIVSICTELGIHSLAIQDILDVNQRPKFQEYDEYCFITLRSTIPTNENGEIITEQISFVLGENFLISFQERKSDHFQHLRTRLREGKGIIRGRSPDYLLYTMLEAILDNYFKTLQNADEEIEKLDMITSEKELSPDVLVHIENNKRFIHYIQKTILSIKEFTLIIEREESRFFDKKHLKYFLEIKDLCLTLLDSCDIMHSSLESSTNLFFSIQGHRMNQVMKTLTIVATIFIPLTFIAGIYGMNFIYMPELEWKYGYVGIWIIIISVFTGMIIYFKKKKWF